MAAEVHTAAHRDAEAAGGGGHLAFHSSEELQSD